MNIGSLIRGLLGDSKPGEARTLELKEGQVVRGVVLSLSESGKEAVVQIQGTPVRAELETPLQQGQTLNLQVGPSGDQGIPVLKPAPAGTEVSPQTMGEALDALGLSDAKAGREIIQAMQSGGLPLVKEIAAKLNAVMAAKPADVPVKEWLEAAVISEKRGLPITSESIKGIRQAVFGPQLHQLLSALEEQLGLWIGQLEGSGEGPAQQSGSTNGATPLDNRSNQGQAVNQASTVLSAGEAAEGSTGGRQTGITAGARGETAATGSGAVSPQPEGEGASGLPGRQGNGGASSTVTEGGEAGYGTAKTSAAAGGSAGALSSGSGALADEGMQAAAADGDVPASAGRAGSAMISGQTAADGAQATAGNRSAAGAEGAARAGEPQVRGAAQAERQAAGEMRAAGAAETGRLVTGEARAGGAVQPGGSAAGKARAEGAETGGLTPGEARADRARADAPAAGGSAQAGSAAAAGTQPRAEALLAKLQGVLGELRDALPQLAALPPSDPAGEPARADAARGNPAAAAPPQPEATHGGAWVARVLKLLGAEHEQLALRGGAAQAAAEPGAVAGGHAGDTVKGMLLQAMASSDVPAAVKEAAGQLVQHLTGQQLLLNTDRTAPFAQVTLFLPLKGPDGTETASVHIQSRRGHKGELDASNCRLWFDLNMKALGQTLVDVQVVDRIVSLKLHNNGTWAQELLESSKDDIRSAMETIGYQLSSFKAESFPAQSQEKTGKGPGSPADYVPDSYRGVDYRI